MKQPLFSPPNYIVAVVISIVPFHYLTGILLSVLGTFGIIGVVPADSTLFHFVAALLNCVYCGYCASIFCKDVRESNSPSVIVHVKEGLFIPVWPFIRRFALQDGYGI